MLFCYFLFYLHVMFYDFILCTMKIQPYLPPRCNEDYLYHENVNNAQCSS